MADKTLFNINVTWEGKEADTIFAKPIFTDPDLLNTVRVIPNIKSKQQIVIDSTLDKILQKITSCSRNPKGALINLSERYLEVENVGVDLEQCTLGLEGSFMEQFLNSGNEIFSLDGTFIKPYVEGKVVNALKLDIPRVIWFGDTASANADYNMVDGFWKQLFALRATNAFMQAPNIPASLPNAYDAAGATAILGIFRGLYDAQPRTLKALPAQRKRFIVSIELAEALQDAYTTLGSAQGDIFIRRNQNGEGLDTFKFKGIDVVGMAHWSDIINTDFAGAKDLRAVLTDTQNLVVGTDRVSDMMSVLFQFHPYQRVNTLEAFFKLGTLVLLPELTVYSTQAA